MKIRSYGCSFILGTDLADPTQTWPAVAAQHLGWDHHPNGKGGGGNTLILDRFLFDLHLDEPDIFYVFQWTWIDRFDYKCDIQNHGKHDWETIRPTQDNAHAQNYYRHYHSEFRDKFITLMCMNTAIAELKRRHLPFIMTCLDDLVMDQTWHCTPGVSIMQDSVRPYLRDFEGKNFLAWSQHHGFPISQDLHPLDQAHAAAAKVILPEIIDTIQHKV